MSIPQLMSFQDAALGRMGAQDSDGMVQGLASSLDADYPGFVASNTCFHNFLSRGNLRYRLEKILEKVNPKDPESVEFWSEYSKRSIRGTKFSPDVRLEVASLVHQMTGETGRDVYFNVYSIVSTEVWNSNSRRVKGLEGLFATMAECYSALFEDDMMERRKRFGITQIKIALLVSIQGQAKTVFAENPQGNKIWQLMEE